jgi:PmbA protein
MPLDEMLSRLSRVVEASPADATEIAWIEARRDRLGTGKRRRDGERRERTLLVRVRESGRSGFHRTGEATVSELENAVRIALAQARLSPPASPPPSTGRAPAAEPAAGRSTDRGPELYDRELAELDEARARDLVQRLAGRSGAARLGWSMARVAVAGNEGRLRSAEVTAAALEVSHGRGPAAGSATAASRSLAGLAPEAVAERARRRAAPEDLAELPSTPAPLLLLAPEATASLVDLLHRFALSAAALREGTSALCDRLGQRVFHPALTLRDDATDPRGLPFPFDLSGEAKRVVDLIGQGVALAAADDESLASHLALLPGSCDEGEVLRLASDEGLAVASLSPIECFDPGGLRFRAVARGVRRIERGALGRAVPDLLWDDRLESVLGRIVGVGREVVAQGGDEPLLQGISAPALVVGPSGSLAVAPGSIL